MAEAIALPQGFVLDEPSADLPQGFQLDAPQPDVPPVGVDLPMEEQRETGVVLAEGGIQGAQDALAGFLSTLNPQARIDIIKNNIPDASIVQEGENTYVDLPIAGSGGQKLRTVLNRPGLSGQDLQDFTGILLQFQPSGSFANLGKTLMSRLTRAFGSGAATEAARQVASTQLGSEQEVSPAEIVTTGAASLGGQALGEAIPAVGKAVIDKASQTSAGKAVTQAVDDFTTALDDINIAKTIKEKTGIELFPAQQTQSPQKLARQEALITTEEGNRIGLPALKKQNEQVGDAVEDFLNTISSPDSVKVAEENFRRVSEGVMIGGQKELNALFKEPYKRVQAKIDAQPEKLDTVVTSVINSIEKRLSNTQNKTARRALQKFAEELDNNRASITGIRDAKDEVDLILDTLGVDSKSASAVKKARNQISSAEKQLNAMLKKEFPELAGLNKRFAEKRGEILGTIERSGFGKFANLDDAQLKNLSRRVFDAAETNPNIIQQTKQTLKRSGVEDAEQAFDDLLRLELTRRINKGKVDFDALMEGDTTAVQNAPAILKNAIFGNQSQEKVILRALSPAQRKHAELLKDALTKASTGRPGGSQTQPRQQALKEIEGGYVSSVLDWVKSPISKTTDLGVEAEKAAKRQAAAEFAFNPKWSPQLTKIEKMTDSQKKAEALKQLLDRVKADVVARSAIISANKEESVQQQGGDDAGNAN